ARSHHGIASWMETHEDTDRDTVIDQVANHYVRAAELAKDLGVVPGVPDDLTDRAVAWVERAAGRAAHRTFHVVAEGLYSEGLSLLDGSPSSCRLKFLTERARARAAMRELDAARLDIYAAIEGARGAG